MNFLNFRKNNNDEIIEIEELILSMEEENNEKTTKSASVVNIFYLKAVEDIKEAITKIENAILKNYPIIIINYSDLKTALKEKEFLSALSASLRNRGLTIRKISNNKVLIITPKTTNIIVG